MTPLLFRSLDMSKADIRNLYDTLGEVEEHFFHILNWLLISESRPPAKNCTNLVPECPQWQKGWKTDVLLVELTFSAFYSSIAVFQP